MSKSTQNQFRKFIFNLVLPGIVHSTPKELSKLYIFLYDLITHNKYWFLLLLLSNYNKYSSSYTPRPIIAFGFMFIKWMLQIETYIDFCSYCRISAVKFLVCSGGCDGSSRYSHWKQNTTYDKIILPPFWIASKASCKFVSLNSRFISICRITNVLVFHVNVINIGQLHIYSKHLLVFHSSES